MIDEKKKTEGQKKGRGKKKGKSLSVENINFLTAIGMLEKCLPQNQY